MSLLMDALKRAEQAKERGATATELSLEPLAATTAAPAAPATPADSPAEPQARMGDASGARPESLPQLSRLEDLDAEFIALARQASPQSQARGEAAAQRGMAGMTSTPRPQATPRPASSNPKNAADTAPRQEAVRNAFAVKQAASTRQTVWLAIGALTALAVAGIGVYFWLQLRPAGGIGVTTPPLAPVPIQRAEHADTPLALPASTSSASRDMATAAAAPIDSRRTGTPQAVLANSRRNEDTDVPKVSRDVTPPSVPIRVARSPERPAPTAAEGYEALRAGNLADARGAYERALRSDPRNLDALNGLASIALREGRGEDAEAIYLRMVEADPRNADANAALAGMRGQGDPVATESRLKSLLAQQPDNAALHFALGNLFAGQGRWNEAQRAYFKAVTGDGDNPDYLFNLAVSLDQLRQPRLAGDYYGQALRAAEGRPAGFDRAQASRRLKELAQP